LPRFSAIVAQIARLQTIDQINALTQAEFVRSFGGVFEHSPWVAERTWPARPFHNSDDLHRAFCETVRGASAGEHLALIRAHPDLVGRAARDGTLTPASAGEQASAGLSKLAPAEIQQFEDYNRRYRERFGFPFVICARLNRKEAILRGFEQRLENSLAEEIAIALDEIFKIARFRLQDLVTQT
jgi:2-oxo-4-hydroxy-4-carboxy-5-ureidoimidazoline decarboxylase